MVGVGDRCPVAIGERWPPDMLTVEGERWPAVIECGLSWEDGVVVSLGGVIGSLFMCMPLSVVIGSGDTWPDILLIGVGLW